MKTKLTSAITSAFWCVNGALLRSKKTGADPLSCRRQQLSPRSFYFLLYYFIFLIFSFLIFLFLLQRAPLLHGPIRSSCWPPPRGQCWGSFSGTWISLLYTTNSPSHYSCSLQPLCYNNASASLTSPTFFLPSVFFSSYNSTISILNSVQLLPSLHSFLWMNHWTRGVSFLSYAVAPWPQTTSSGYNRHWAIVNSTRYAASDCNQIPIIHCEGTIYNCCFLETSIWPTWLEYVNTLLCRRIFSRRLVDVGFPRFFTSIDGI